MAFNMFLVAVILFSVGAAASADERCTPEQLKKCDFVVKGSAGAVPTMTVEAVNGNRILSNAPVLHNPAAFQDRRALSVAVVGRAGEWPFATDWSSQAIGAEFRRANSGRGTVAAAATPAGWSDLSLTDEEIRDGIALEAELRGRDRRRKSRRALDDAELVAGVGGPAEVSGAAGGGESEREIAVEGPRRGVPGKGRNAYKRNAKKAKDYGLALVELKGKELQRVVSWMDLPEETLEAVQLAQVITRRGKNGWRRQLSYIGGLLRGVSEERMDEAIFAAKSGVVPSFVDEESGQGEGEMVETEGAVKTVL
ncbi:unnamed protein product [Closterium sp. Naga37s-1]|nr:unnamed protein product [Closterium sp. Naga37s-1]